MCGIIGVVRNPAPPPPAPLPSTQIQRSASPSNAKPISKALSFTSLTSAAGEGEPHIPFAKGDKIGKTVDYVAGRNRYIGHLISLSTCSYKGLKVGLDTANGASDDFYTVI